MENNNYQYRYWRELDQMKVHVFYLESYLEKTSNYDRWLNMFLAVMANGSIASWVVWKDYSFIWGFLIALSQLINAIKVYFPYQKRLKSLEGITKELETLFLVMETAWFDVSEGKLTEKDIHKQHMDMKKKKQQLTDKYFGGNPLPHDDKLMNKAKDKAAYYFKMFYFFEE
jgi:hypothetical protein